MCKHKFKFSHQEKYYDSLVDVVVCEKCGKILRSNQYEESYSTTGVGIVKFEKPYVGDDLRTCIIER